MNALGCRKAKRTVSPLWPGGIQSSNRRGDDGRGFVGTLTGRHQFRGCKFDGHFGIH
jgi:hypothetical protein